MEEKILYTIDMSCECFVSIPRSHKQRLAKDITSMMKEFIEWKDSFTEFDITEGLYAVQVETHVIEDFALDELFQYWLTNIYKK